jgi:flagellar basal-body rod modification protein FlgD
MIQEITAARAQPAGAAAPTAATSVDFQSFLRLLTAQLRNQDPLSPLDSTQFVAQLASFSTVEQLVNANGRLDAIASTVGSTGIEKFAAWIGLEAEVTGAPAFHSGALTPFRIPANASATRVDLVVRDAAGAEVGRGAANNSNDIQFWDGGDAPHGGYFLTAEYFDGSKLIGSKPASTFAVVDQARLVKGEVKLVLAGGVEVDPADVIGLSGSR